MTKQLLAFGAASVIAAAALACAVQAAPAPARAAPAATGVAEGPPIAGLCVISIDQAISSSAVGQYVSQRMNQIVAQVKAELNPENAAIETEGRSLEAARATLAPAAFQTRAQALQARINNLRQKADLRQREVQATEQKSLNRIAQELDPIVRQIYQQKRCSALFDKRSVILNNPDMDLSSQAVASLNAKIQQFAFDREHLDAAAPAR
ncbi:MAG: OmpH family outer membrane protein [Caulobacteraceae bacterium]